MDCEWRKSDMIRIQILIGLLFLVLGFIHADPLSERQIYQASVNHVTELIKQKKYSQGLNILKGFKKKYPNTKFKYDINLFISKIILEYIGQVEKGFAYLELLRDQGESQDFKELEKQYAPLITEIRLNRLYYYIEKHFAKYVECPLELDDLMKDHTFLKINDMTDGWGNRFHYERLRTKMSLIGSSISFQLYSKGEDGLPDTKDDIHYNDDDQKVLNDYELIKTYKTDQYWKAEIKIKNFKNNKAIEVYPKLKIDDLLVVGVMKEGVVLLKDNDPIILLRR